MRCRESRELVFNWQANVRLDDHQAGLAGMTGGAERASRHMALIPAPTAHPSTSLVFPQSHRHSHLLPPCSSALIKEEGWARQGDQTRRRPS